MYLRLDKKNVGFTVKRGGLIFQEMKLFMNVLHQLTKKFIYGLLAVAIIAMSGMSLVVRKSLL